MREGLGPTAGCVALAAGLGLGAPALEASTLTLVDAGAYVSGVIEQTPTDSFASGINTVPLQSEEAYSRAGEPDAQVGFARLQADPAFAFAGTEAQASLTAGTIGMAGSVATERTDAGLLAGGFSYLVYGFLYQGLGPLTLPTGWASWSVDGDWELEADRGRGFAGALVQGRTSSDGPYRINQDDLLVSGPLTQTPVSTGANAYLDGVFDGFAPMTNLIVSSGSPEDVLSQLSTDDFAVTVNAPSITVQDGEFLSVFVSHTFDIGVFDGTGLIDGLGTGRLELNLTGPLQVDMSLLGETPPEWLLPALSGTVVIPLPPAGLLLLGGLGGLALLRARRPGGGWRLTAA